MLDLLINTINSVGDFSDAITNTVPKIVTLCAFISAMVPAPVKDSALSTVHKVINLCAFNFNHASNAK